MTAKGLKELCLDEDLRDMVEALTDIKIKWFRIGLQLGLSVSVLDCIEERFSTNYDKALYEMLKEWLKHVSDEPHTWKTIVEVLRLKSVGERKVADDIDSKYIKNESSMAATIRCVSDPGDQVIIQEDIPHVQRSKSENSTTGQKKIPHTTSSESECQKQEQRRSPIEQPWTSYYSLDPEKFLYPFLDTKGLTEYDFNNLQGRLTNEYMNITSRYSTLYRDIHSSLTKRGVTPKQLAGVLMELSAFALRKSDSKKPLLEECLDEIENAEDNQTAFKILRPYGSFFDCHVIKHIVNSELCTTDDKQKLQEYINELDDYCQRNVFECPHYSTIDPKFTSLVVKVDDIITTKFTMKALHAFCAKIAETLTLKGHTPRICSVEDGCLQFTCQIPPFIKEEIFPLSHQQEERLRKLQVQCLTCDEEVYFSAQTHAQKAPLTLERSEVQIYSQEESLSTGRLGTGRYCYIHSDGITVKQDQGFFECSSKSHIIKVQLPADQGSFLSKGQLCRIDSDSSFEQPSLKEPKRQHSLYDIRENQERALSRPLQVFLMDNYTKDIEEKLTESLRWMYERGLTPKLEGRFGELCWRKVSDDRLTTEEFSTEGFAQLAFESASSYFYTRIGKGSPAAVTEICSKQGGLLDEIETYDFKLKTHMGKLDIRVKFTDSGKPEVLAIKKAEYKVAIFDILCLNRKYDMRVSLNNYEAASIENPIVKKFLSTLSMPKPRTVLFSSTSKTSDDQWTVALIRHKEIQTYFFQQPQYVVTISTVRQFEVDDEADTAIESVCIDSKEPHTEIELHNLSWIVSFGRLLDLKPAESLVLLMNAVKIPNEILKVLGSTPEEWTPEWVMDDFVKSEFMKMMESINKTMNLQQ